MSENGEFMNKSSDVELLVLFIGCCFLIVPLLIGVVFSYFLVGYCDVSIDYAFPIIITVALGLWIVAFISYKL